MATPIFTLRGFVVAVGFGVTSDPLTSSQTSGEVEILRSIVSVFCWQKYTALSIQHVPPLKSWSPKICNL